MKPLNRRTASVEQLYPERVLQFGGGNFLRAFSNWLIDLLNEQTDFGGAVIIVKPTPNGAYEVLRKQEGLYHVVLNEWKDGQLHTNIRLISCIRQIIQPYQEWETFLATAELPYIRFILSNTTEAGISFEDKLPYSPGEASLNFPAKLTHWLYRRFTFFQAAADKGCIFLPCELIEANGQTLKACILNYAKAWKLEMAFQEWIETYNFFCDTLVDRIVSGYPQEKAAALQATLGYEDQLLVEGEAYHSWVIQGKDLVAKELPFSQTSLNVRFVRDLDIHRQIKVRLLNGAHTALVPTAYLAGHRLVSEAVADEHVFRFIKGLLYEEIIPTISHPRKELEAFAAAVLQRFANRSIRHQLLSIALNSTSKFKTRLLPSLLAYYHQQGQLPKHITLALAALVHFYRGEWQGDPISLKDAPDAIAFFKDCWAEHSDDLNALAQAVLANEMLWGQDLNQVPELRELLARFLDRKDFVLV